MGDILTLAKKLERAMRNQTGFTVSADEVTDVIASSPILDAIYAEKLKELKLQCLAKQAPSNMADTGSTSGGTAPPPISGRSPTTTRKRAPLSIAALSEGL